MGFGEILHLDDCCVPRCFVKWIADNVSTEEELIRIGSKSIKLSPQSVTQTFGTPEGHLSVDSDEIIGKAEFLDLVGISDVPSIRFFGKRILAKEVLPHAVFCRCFMAVSLRTLFCPNSSTKISTKYMGALVVVDLIKDRNWSKFIHEWTISYIKKYLKEPSNANQLTQTLGGCIYHLAVRCLDFFDFGPVNMPTTLPRVRVWKGKLIKVFSDMYMDTNGKYGAYAIKDISETCYYLSNTKVSNEEAAANKALKLAIDTTIGDVVGPKIKDNIAACYASIMKDEESRVCLKVKDLAVQVVQAFLSNQNSSQDTLKISSSHETSYKTAINSGSTIKLAEEEEDHCDNDALVESRRTCKEVNSGTTEKLINEEEKRCNSYASIQSKRGWKEINSASTEKLPDEEENVYKKTHITMMV